MASELERPPRSSPAAAATAISAVLGEILLRVGFPTTLVGAAAVSRRWLRVASDPSFLRRFRHLNPPRLLGFYVTTSSIRGTPLASEFVPIPMRPQPPELASVLRRASFSFDNIGVKGTWMLPTILDCRNGNVFIHDAKQQLYGVHSPLYPERGMAIAPIPPPGVIVKDRAGEILSKQGNHGLEYFWVRWLLMRLDQGINNVIINVYLLRDGAWHIQNTYPSVQFPQLLPMSNFVLAHDKIYRVSATVRRILVLDMMSSSMSTIKFPDGVVLCHEEDNILSPADVSGIYLIHVQGLQLRIWLHRGDSGGSVGNWLLIDTICLQKMCAKLAVSCQMNEDELTITIKGVGDNAEFVFLKMGKHVIYLDLKSRESRKVYELENDHYLDRVYPFLMIWPPTFPEKGSSNGGWQQDNTNVIDQQMRFYDDCVPPRYHLLVRDYGHLDMLDDGLPHGIDCMCKRNDGHTKALARRTIGGLMVAFLRAKLEHNDKDRSQGRDHPHSPSLLPPATAMSAVLSNDDLLGEILLRVGFPTTLVRASLVCKRWLRFVSHPAFLRRFRKLHLPRLLGYFVATSSSDHPRFVPMQPPPPEPACGMTGGGEHERPPRPSPAAAAIAISAVLGDDDLLGEILLRLGFPTTLVRASLVCKRWLRVIASEPSFLRRFRQLHPPRLLGYYVGTVSPDSPNFGRPLRQQQFVPLLPQPPELACVLRRARFSLDAVANGRRNMRTTVEGCRDGGVIITLSDPVMGGSVFQEVHSPLCPERGVVTIPLPPISAEADTTYRFTRISSKQGSCGVYFWLSMQFNRHAKATIHVYLWHDGAWHNHFSATIQLPEYPSESCVVLTNDKIYMMDYTSSIFVLDMTSSSLSTIELPDVVARDGIDGSTFISPADDSGVYLVHLEEQKLQLSCLAPQGRHRQC
uniref:F-box domain-containing protein n=1 Tax=Leersia perrieri TaxID=77586 RepID=A0A0D9VEX0_9ORYZ